MEKPNMKRKVEPVRKFVGFMMIITFIPILFFLFTVFDEERRQVQGFHDVLDEKIVINSISLPQAGQMLDKDGNIFSEYRQPFRIVVKDIPTFIQDVFLVSEDRYFYEHVGFDFAAISRAIIENTKSSSIEQGGSTITQQLSRNLFLDHERTYNRKLSEVLYAYQLERKLSKNEIITAYLNTIYFHNQVYGVEAAAQFYFNKQLLELSEAEMAFIAAIPNNPAKYNPLLHFDATKARQERLIDQMVEAKKITAKKADLIKNEEINLYIKERIDLYPDYAVYVEEELRQLIAKQDGFQTKIEAAKNEEEKKRLEEELNEKFETILSKGVKIHTALDPQLQVQTTRAVNERLPYPKMEGAAVVIDHEQKEIVALSGGKHYKKHEFNRSFQAFRQPGSAIKPLLVYGPYLNKYHASITELVNANNYCKRDYCPKNYGGGQYGKVTLKKALARSYNTPAVRLFEKTGIDEAFSILNAFSFTHIVEEDYRLPAAIGGFTYGMSPLELTDAYTVFVDGTYQPSRAIRQVTDLEGNLLFKWEDNQETIWSKSTNDKMRELLKEVVNGGTATRATAPSTYIGGKTGTTNDYHDFWFIGLVDQYTAGVWIGYDMPANMQRIEKNQPEISVWNGIWQ